MNRISISLILLLGFFSLPSHAGEFLPGEAKIDYSFLVNLVPGETSDTVPDAYKGSVDETATQIQFNWSWNPEDSVFEQFGLKSQPYYSLRYIQRVFHTENETDGGVENFSALMFMYGSRYFFDRFGYSGPAIGWYAGFAMGDGEGYSWQQSGAFNQIVYSEFEDSGTIGAFEFVYTHTFARHFIIEASHTVAWLDETPAITPSFTAIILGYKF